MGRPILAIDFGDSFTAGASRINDLDEPVGGADSRHLPSLVFVGPDGRLTAGGPTEQLAEAFPERVVHDLRHLLITSESVRVADRDIPATTLAAALLRQVMLDAAGQRKATGGLGGEFDRVVLTYPARWGPRQLRPLGQAATEAGLPRPWFLTEAEAVVAFHDPPPGSTVAVYDLGGRSLDVTVLRRAEQGFEILEQPGGHDRFGGGDLDQALLRIVAERARDLDAAAWEELTGRRNGPELLRQEIVGAKHTLSDQDGASLLLDGFSEAITVTRAEFEDATDQMLRWSVDELPAAIERAGLSSADLAAVYLAGGATRMPKVAELITERLGRAPTTAPDPKAVFALGALSAYAQTAQQPALQGPPVQATDVRAPTVQTAALPVLDAGSLPDRTAPVPARRSGSRPGGPRLAALAMIPLTVAVVAGGFVLRSHLGPSESTGASSSTTTLPGAPTNSPTSALPSPTISETDTSGAPDPSTSPEESPTPEGGSGIEEGTYSVSLSGTVSGQAFERTAQLQVMSTVARVGTTDDVNPIEVCLRSGFPAGTPEVGAIWFGTTTACFPERGAQIDMATVEVSGDTVTVRPVERIAAGGLNQFTASGNSIYACLYQPVAGSMTVTFSGDSASGELDINGYGGPCQAIGTNATYTARFAS
ncbi:Hsp70 family protein [Actinomadura macra]|uniref:Hsp70 family protein n=1 Tax=Actinomadura macra TaxID=46164 RepID=UPI00082B62F2|nr:Hsp70 family protein [Actinomadura macra]